MRRIKLFLLVLVAGLSIFASSCKRGGSSAMPNITGKGGEMVVVIPKEIWQGRVGDTIRRILAQPQLSLPQNEPIFDLISVPPDAFKDIFKPTRNILTVRISPNTDQSGVEFKTDMWAHPQAVVSIQATSQDEFVDLFMKNADKIVAYFIKAEKDRQIATYIDYHDHGIRNELLKDFEVDLKVAPGFKIVTKSDDFAWIRYDTPEITQGIFLYTYKYDSDSTFTPEYLTAKRNEFLKKYVPGPTSGSYMATEERVEPVFNILTFKGNYASEMRGLWMVEHDFMGGPYINLSVLDASKQRVVTLDGFVYAPRFNKRNYLRQVEAMIYTLEFPHQAKNDKISSQIKMGN